MAADNQGAASAAAELEALLQKEITRRCGICQYLPAASDVAMLLPCPPANQGLGTTSIVARSECCRRITLTHFHSFTHSPAVRRTAEKEAASYQEQSVAAEARARAAERSLQAQAQQAAAAAAAAQQRCGLLESQLRKANEEAAESAVRAA